MLDKEQDCSDKVESGVELINNNTDGENDNL